MRKEKPEARHGYRQNCGLVLIHERVGDRGVGWELLPHLRRGADMKKAGTRWWVVASLVAVAAVLVGMLLGGVFGGLLPPE
jgi:anti-sigma factor RsiW